MGNGKIKGLKAKLVALLTLGTFLVCAILTIVATRVSRIAMEKEFTKQAERVLQLAKSFAKKFHHPYVGTEHLLLAFLKYDNSMIYGLLNNEYNISYVDVNKYLGAGVTKMSNETTNFSASGENSEEEDDKFETSMAGKDNYSSKTASTTKIEIIATLAPNKL